MFQLDDFRPVSGSIKHAAGASFGFSLDNNRQCVGRAEPGVLTLIEV